MVPDSVCYVLSAVEGCLKRMHSSNLRSSTSSSQVQCRYYTLLHVHPALERNLKQLACPHRIPSCLDTLNTTLTILTTTFPVPHPLNPRPFPQIASNEVSEPLAEAGITRTQLEAALAEVRKTSGAGPINSETGDANFEALSKYGTDLTERAPRADPVIGRDDEIRRVVRVLCRRTKNNPVLIGEPGVGKTAIVEGLAQRIVKVGNGGCRRGRWVGEGG